MLVHPEFNPIAFSLGPLEVHWYGLMYLVGFMAFLFLGRIRARAPWRGITPVQVEDLLFYGVVGVILGGRLGYCLFYQPGYYISHPLSIFAIWQGGMSAHGGMIGVMLAMWAFARTQKISFWKIADFVVPLAPIGLFFGRIGNFINGELWGRISSGEYPWLMIFPQSGSWEPRHPSQLYEALGEGLFLGILLWALSQKERAPGVIAGTFVLGYGVIRFVVEFFREPDAFLGLQALSLSQGQWLSIPLIVVGLLVLGTAPYRQKKN